jgi:hypothetical protein
MDLSLKMLHNAVVPLVPVWASVCMLYFGVRGCVLVSTGFNAWAYPLFRNASSGLPLTPRNPFFPGSPADLYYQYVSPVLRTAVLLLLLLLLLLLPLHSENNMRMHLSAREQHIREAVILSCVEYVYICIYMHDSERVQ